MDDPADGGYSRAPELEDLLKLCAALNREGARYLLIGGFAVILHGFVRGTKDIDLLVEASEENVRAVKRALAALPDNAAALLADHEVRTEDHQTTLRLVRMLAAVHGQMWSPSQLGKSLGIDGELWALEAKLTASPSPAQMRRLDRVADLIGASRRWLITQSATVIGDERRAVGNLGWAVERLREET